MAPDVSPPASNRWLSVYPWFGHCVPPRCPLLALHPSILLLDPEEPTLLSLLSAVATTTPQNTSEKDQVPSGTHLMLNVRAQQ